MIKKVSIKNQEERGWRIYESLSSLISTLEEYGFICGGSHALFQNTKKSAWFFCEDRDGRFPSGQFPCSNCKYKGTIYRLDLDLTGRELICFGDMPGDESVETGFLLPYPAEEYSCQVTIKYEGGEGFIADYCRKLHLLNATDWTHAENNIETAREVLEALNEIVNFKEVTQRINEEYSEEEKKEEKCIYKVKLGADPEFEQLKSWNSYSVIPTNIHTYQCDTGEIGVDGAGYQIEFRPDPADTPEEIVDNIGYLFRELTVPVSIKGDKYPLGGHIHIGLPSELRGNSLIRRAVVEILDDFLGRKLLSLSGEARGIYKSLGTYREQPHGIEYRPVPSAYLLNPDFAYLVFKIAKNVVETLLNERTIEYEEEPGFYDYIKIAKLTEKEYERFLKHIEEYFEYQGQPVNKNWVSVEEIPFILRFRDEWDADNKKIFKEIFSQYEFQLKSAGIFEVVLYGLKRDRGDYVIAGFNCEGYETIDHPSRKHKGCFGIPARLRQDVVGMYEIEDIVKSILAQLNVTQAEKQARISLEVEVVEIG